MSTDSNQPNDTLMLYMDELCGYCHRVRQVIDQLGIDVELRDVHANRDWGRELLDARGRMTVPVLRRDTPDGESHWMPESRDIINWLKENYA